MRVYFSTKMVFTPPADFVDMTILAATKLATVAIKIIIIAMAIFLFIFASSFALLTHYILSYIKGAGNLFFT